AAPPSKRTTVLFATIAVFVTLATNQVFHSELWEPLHNDSVRPRVNVLSASLAATGELELELERPVGPETYGAFVVSVRLLDEHQRLVRAYGPHELSALPVEAVRNRWLVKVRPGPHGLVVPLCGRAKVRLPASLPTSTDDLADAAQASRYVIELEDVSGLAWRHDVRLDAHTRRDTTAPPASAWR